MKLLLASASPRRRELLGGLDIPFEVVKVGDVEECYPEHLVGGDIPLHIARLKMDAYAAPLLEGEVLITADTIVWSEGEVLGKPRDREEACRMLTGLSGKTHQVITGVTLRTIDRSHTFSCVTDVTFADLTQEQIKHYVDNYSPFDKAGAYGVQEWIGYIGIDRIDGSYFTVMGFPIHLVYSELQYFLD